MKLEVFLMNLVKMIKKLNKIWWLLIIIWIPKILIKLYNIKLENIYIFIWKNKKKEIKKVKIKLLEFYLKILKVLYIYYNNNLLENLLIEANKVILKESPIF